MNLGEWSCARSGLKNDCFSDSKIRDFVYGCSVQFEGFVNKQNVRYGQLKIHIELKTFTTRFGIKVYVLVIILDGTATSSFCKISQPQHPLDNHPINRLVTSFMFYCYSK